MMSSPHEQGQGLVEYALILVLIAIVVIAAVAAFGTALNGYYEHAVNELAKIVP